MTDSDDTDPDDDECHGEDDDYCPECFSTDIFQNGNGDDVCTECRTIIEY